MTAFSLPERTKPIDVPNGTRFIDLVHAAKGYASASWVSTERLKLQVRMGDAAYNYDLPNDGTPIVVPMNMGNGDYAVRVMENVGGNSYAQVASRSTIVRLSSPFAPFLVPNVYCWYEPGCRCVRRARRILRACDTDREAASVVYRHVPQVISYDEDKARELSGKSGYVPNPDATLSEGKGICFDYASLTAAMLRCVGIPAKVVTGWAGKDGFYHAWVEVYVDGKWFRMDPTLVTVGGAGNYKTRFTY